MRPSKDEYYLGIALAVAARSTCILRQYGAIIVRNDVVVSSGYNGAARKVKDCMEFGFCLKEAVHAPPGKGYEFCPSVHAEENAIINAARQGSSVLDAVLFLVGKNFKDNSIAEAEPCERCRRAIINSGMKNVVFRKKDGSIRRIEVSEWVREDELGYQKKIEQFKGRKLGIYS